MAGQRARRAAELIRSYLSEMLMRNLSDPRLGSLVVTEVNIGDDLGHARVGVRLMVGDDSEKNRRRALKGLTAASARLRSGLAARLKLRRVPEVTFYYDTGHDAAHRVNELLAEIAKEPKGQDE